MLGEGAGGEGAVAAMVRTEYTMRHKGQGAGRLPPLRARYCRSTTW